MPLDILSAEIAALSAEAASCGRPGCVGRQYTKCGAAKEDAAGYSIGGNNCFISGNALFIGELVNLSAENSCLSSENQLLSAEAAVFSRPGFPLRSVAQRKIRGGVSNF
ncbi:hypothetical protein [Rossellomorea aquimaris]|uniref:Uncharacterized protein n=1 Tax=Rossellomorea aquimaris TaxID=189382 RepID=A0A5D4TAC6_9BACI|nr:hypothetical protein [Rossellomorea aquimaris]TYS72587.1 hypothetical protein FZC80_20650 [Rossellomorea aquimaris]